MHDALVVRIVAAPHQELQKRIGPLREPGGNVAAVWRAMGEELIQIRR